jgi:hypothetical protein
MKYCEAFKIEVPDSFPLSAWESFYVSGKLVTDGKEDVGAEFVLAMGCVVYRYKTCKESIDSMIACWHACGKALTFDGYYSMQRDLFSFFTCGLSVIESLAYAIYITATQKNPSALTWGDLKARKQKTDPVEISATLTLAYPGSHPVITEINNLTATPEWKDWKEYRNTMIHRSLPSRLIEGSMGGPPPPNEMVKYAKSWSHPELRANESQMAVKLDWLAGHVEKIAAAAAGL